MVELIGTDILYRKWEAASAGASPRAVFLLVHGLGAQSARWDFLAGFLARNGHASYGIAEQMKSPRLAKKLCASSLFLISGTDFLVDERASRKLYKKLKLEDKAIIEYPEMHHALSIDLGRDQVFRDIVDWAGKRA